MSENSRKIFGKPFLMIPPFVLLLNLRSEQGLTCKEHQVRAYGPNDFQVHLQLVIFNPELAITNATRKGGIAEKRRIR